MFGEILSAIGGVAKGFMDRNAAKGSAQDTDFFNRHKIRMTVKDARAAGIHPLAALGSPIAGSWATPVARHSMGDAVAAGASSLAQSMGPKNELTRLQLESERARIRNLDSDTANNLAAAQSRTLAAAARRGGQTVDIANLAAPPTVGSPVDPSAITKPGQPFMFMKRRIARDPSYMSAASDMQNEAGELVGDVGGAIGAVEAWARDWLWQDQVNQALFRARSRSRHHGGSIPIGTP